MDRFVKSFFNDKKTILENTDPSRNNYKIDNNFTKTSKRIRLKNMQGDVTQKNYENNIVDGLLNKGKLTNNSVGYKDGVFNGEYLIKI